MISIIPKAITVTGLCLDIIGVYLLAYDALFGAEKHWLLKMYDDQLRSLEWTRSVSKTMNQRLAEQPHSLEYLTRVQNENKAKFDTWQSEIEKKIEGLNESYPNVVLQKAKRGLIFVVAGFIFQICGTILS